MGLERSLILMGTLTVRVKKLCESVIVLCVFHPEIFICLVFSIICETGKSH